MKKTKFLVAAVTSIVLASASITYAKIPNKSLIIGGKAFHIDYVFNKEHVGEVNKIINTDSIKNIYYVDSSGRIKDIFSPTTLMQEKDLNNGGDISYNPGGKNYKFRGGEYSFIDRPQVKFKVSLGSIEGNKFVVNITYNKDFNEADDKANTIEAKYIKFDSLDKIIDINEEKSLIIFTSDRKIPFRILDDKNLEIGIGQIDLSNMRVGDSTEKICELYKTEPKCDLETFTGNVQNSGEVMLDKEYVYYINSSDNGKLYKSKRDGSNNELISEDKAKNICIIGEYIYYSNVSDSGKLYKIKNDGSDRKKLSEYSVNYIDKLGTELYFINVSDGNKIYKLDAANDVINATKVSNDPADSLAIMGGQIYYANKNDSSKLHTINTGNTGISSKVLDLSVKKFIGKDLSNMIVCTTDGCIYKYDGSTTTKINLNIPNYSNTTKEDRAANINVIGNYIYYKSINDGGRLYRVNINGGDAEIVVHYSVDNIYIVDSENLYFTQGNRVNKLNISRDSSGKMNFIVTPTSRENTKPVIKVNTGLKGSSPLNLPHEVEVEFNDHTIGKLPAYWDTNNPILLEDEIIYRGKLLGGRDVQYKYNEQSACVNTDATKENIIRNFNGTYTLIFSEGGIKPGDRVSIYTDGSYNSIAQQIANRDGVVTFGNLRLQPASKIYITRKERGKTESEKQEVKKSIQLEPRVISVDDFEDIYNGVDGRDITIKLDEGRLKKFSKNEVYIIPKGRIVDLVTYKGLKGYDLSSSDLWIKSKDGSYTGTNKITTDSMGNTLNNGFYDVYLVGTDSTTGDKYCSDAKSSMLKSELPATFMSPEVIGDKFKAQSAMADVKVKLNVRALNGVLVNDITTNYNINIFLNGENLNKNNINYEIENNNSVILKKEFLNTLDCGTYRFEVVLTDKTTLKEVKSLFNVVVNSGADFKTTINTPIFTKGYSPKSVEITLTGKDKNGQDLTESQLKDSIILVNDKSITNFQVKGTSIILQKEYLDTLDPGKYNIKIVNKEIDLNEQTGFEIASSQAQLTPIIEGEYGSFKTGQAKEDMVVKLNAKDEQGKDCEFDKIEGIYYEGTKMPDNMYKLEGNRLTLFAKLLNQLSCGDKEIIIRGKVKETSKIIEGKLNIRVSAAAELKFMLRESGKDESIIGSFQNLTYDVVKIDENNKNVERSKIDLSNVKLEKGSYVLKRNIDYYIDNINKTITVKKDYLDTLIAGQTSITVSLGGLSKDIIVTAKEGQTEISAKIEEDNLLKYRYGSAQSHMTIGLKGISSQDVIRVEIKTKAGTTTYLSKGTHYTLDEENNKVKINKSYLNELSASDEISPYNVVISDVNKSANVSFEVLSVARFKFEDGNSNKDFNISNLVGDLSAKILEENCDGKDITTDLSSITLRINNEGKELAITPADREIQGDTIIIKEKFLKALPSGRTEIEVWKDGVVTPAKFILIK